MQEWKEAYKEKVIKPEELESKVRSLKDQGLKIATVNGSFDLMTAGHLEILYQGSQTADILIVALNSDDSIKKYKSPKRPIIPLEDRIRMMAAIEFVDYVTWFEETDPIQLLEKIKPHVHVNGSDYGADCIEAPTVKKNGGRIEIIHRGPGISTSEIIKKCASL